MRERERESRDFLINKNMGKDKKRKLSETSSSVGELQRQGNFKIDPEEIPKALDDSSWP